MATPSPGPEAAVIPAPRPLRPGASVAGYRVVRRLRPHARGDVYEARREGDGLPVALQPLAPGQDGLPEASRRDRAEAVARLAGPELAPLLEVAGDGGQLILVTGLVEGEPLSARLERGPLDAAEAVRVALAVARALALGHAAGVAHLELSPERILVGGDGAVRVLDLGLAHLLGERGGDVVPTPWTAPEQASGAPTDERADVFALGAILFAALTGREPERQVRPGAGGGWRPPVVEVDGAPGLGPLLARLLAADPLERPRDGAAVVAALQPVAAAVRPGARTVVRPARGRERAPWKALAFLLALALLVAGMAALVSGRGAVAGPAPAELAAGAAGPAVAVLPFADLSQGQDQAYLADGLSEEILEALARLPGLQVVGRSSSFSVRGQEGDLRRLGERLGAGAVLEGSVRREARRLRVTARLVDVRSGFELWSQGYERELSDLATVRADVARAVATALHVRLLPPAGPPAGAAGEAEALDLLLQARAAQRRGSPEGWRLALERYRQSTAAAPGFAPGWAGQAVLLGDLASLGLADDAAAVEAGRRQAMEAAERAVALAPGLPDGWSARGILRTWCTWDFQGALADLRRARLLQPSGVETLHRLAFVERALGHHAGAVALARRAAELDPLDPWAQRVLASILMTAGDLAEARAAGRRVLELSPETTAAHHVLGMIELLDGRPDAALAAFRADRRAWGRLTGEALALFTLGDQAGSRRALAALAGDHALEAAYQVAQVHAWRGERDQAFDWLEQAVAQHDPGLRMMRVDPVLAPLRPDPRYAALLEHINLDR